MKFDCKPIVWIRLANNDQSHYLLYDLEKLTLVSVTYR